MWARTLDSVKGWPLWLLAVTALSVTVLVVVPDFRALASPTTATALVYAAIVAWIFMLARGFGGDETGHRPHGLGVIADNVVNIGRAMARRATP